MKKDIPIDKRSYPEYSGKVFVEFKKGAEFGTKTITFDEFGIHEKIITITKVDMKLVKEIGYPEQYIPKPSAFLEIKNDSMVYTIDLNLKKGFKRKKIKLSKRPKVEDHIKEYYVKDSIYNDKKCKYYELPQDQMIFMWKGLTVKTEILNKKTNVEIFEKIKSIDFDYKISNDEFDIPKDVKIE